MTPEMQELIDRYVGGLASDQEIRRVDDLIQQDPVARRAVFGAAAMEVNLRQLLAKADGNSAGEHSAGGGRIARIGWQRWLKYAAVFAIAIAGWGAALVVSGRYRVKCKEYETAIKRVDELARLASPPLVAGGRADRVVQTRGLVLALDRGASSETPVLAGSPVPVGRSLWTCPWGAAALRLADGVTVDLERNSEAELSPSRVEGEHEIALAKGILFVTRLDSPSPGHVIVRTSNGAVVVNQAQVAVAVDKGQTTVEVADGQADVRTSDGRVLRVAAGYYIIIGGGREPQLVKGRLSWKLSPLGAL